MDYNIRKMEKRDCMSVAHVITIAWNETYKGIIDDDILNNLYSNEEERANNSLKNFDTNEDEQLVLEVDNKVVGFANVGKPNDTTYNNCGELFAIYIIGKYKGKGYGKKLFESCKDTLKEMGFDKMIIGCLEGNPSNEFYKHMGGKLIKTRIYKKLNLPENVYLFEQI